MSTTPPAVLLHHDFETVLMQSENDVNHARNPYNITYDIKRDVVRRIDLYVSTEPDDRQYPTPIELP